MAEKSTSKSTAKTKKKTKKAVKKKAAAKKATTTKSTKTKTAKKTAVKKASSKPVIESKKKAANTSGTKKAKLAVKTDSPHDSKRMALIQQTAYYIAEKRGFAGGDPEQDWLLAEKQVEEMLKQSST